MFFVSYCQPPGLNFFVLTRLADVVVDTKKLSQKVAYFLTFSCSSTKVPIVFSSVQMTMWHGDSYFDISHMLLLIFFLSYWRALIVMFL